MRFFACGSEARSLLVLLLLALLLRLGFGMTRQGLQESADEQHWDQMARALWQRGVLAPEAGTYRPPLYPLLIAATYQIVGHRPAGVRLWQAILGTATCGLLYTWAQRLGGKRTGLIAAALAAGYPPFVFFSGVLMAETLLIFLTAAVLVQTARLEKTPSLANAAGLGLLLGLAGLGKPVLLFWAPFLLGGWWRRSEDLRARGWQVATALAGIALAIAPWTLRNALSTGHLVPISTNVGINLLIGHEPGATGTYRDGVDYLEVFDRLVAPEQDPVLRDRLAVRRVLGWIWADPGRAAGLAGRKLFLLWRPWISGESAWRNALVLLTSGPLMILGLGGLGQMRGRGQLWNIASLLVALSLVHALFFAHFRFRLPADAALIGPAALTLERLWDRWRGVRR